MLRAICSCILVAVDVGAGSMGEGVRSKGSVGVRSKGSLGSMGSMGSVGGSVGSVGVRSKGSVGVGMRHV